MVINYWLLLWFLFMVLFLVAPIGYGWGYRGWGPPYPSFMQRRRSRLTTGPATFNHHEAWGWGGDLIWLLLVVGVCWALAVFWWR